MLKPFRHLAEGVLDVVPQQNVLTPEERRWMLDVMLQSTPML